MRTASASSGKSSRNASRPGVSGSVGGSQCRSVIRSSPTLHRAATSAPNVIVASRQIASVAASLESAWKRGATRRILSSAWPDSSSRLYSRDRSSAWPPRSATIATIASSFFSTASDSSKRRLSEPTTSPATCSGTATPAWAYAVRRTPSGNSSSNVARSRTTTGRPSRAARAIGARASRARRAPGGCVWPSARTLGSTTTTSSPSMSPTDPPRAPMSGGVRSISTCATSDGVSAAESASATPWIPSRSSTAPTARSRPIRMAMLTQTTATATTRGTPQRSRSPLDPSSGWPAGPTKRRRPSPHPHAIASKPGPTPPYHAEIATAPTRSE